MVREGVTRRRALQLVSSATAIGLTGCAGANDGDGTHSPSDVDEATTQVADKTSTRTKQLDLPLIDVHTHLVPKPAFDREPFSADQAVEWMDANGVDRIVLNPLESPTSWSYPIPTWWMLQQAQKHPDRFIPFGTIGPRIIDQFGREKLVNRLASYVEQGAKGIGELKSSLPIDDRRMQAVYATCADLGVPVLVHMDKTNGTDEIGLPKLETMISSHPDTAFIAHGPGWWSQIARDPKQFGGYPNGPVEPGGPIPSLLGGYDNIYADISGGSGWNALIRDQEFTQSFLEDHHEQTVFGTDKLSASQQVDQFALFEQFDLSRDQWKKIRAQNIKSVLPES